MGVIVFLLGHPGSGKSQVARCIKGDESPIASVPEGGCLPEDWDFVHITDYKHLLSMFWEEEEQKLASAEKCFEPSEHGGLNVTELGFSRGVLDEALRRVNADILREIEGEQRQKLILVEFARNNYSSIKRVFDTRVLENASALYLHADPGVCQSRVRRRARDPRWEDDIFVSEAIMKSYYKEEDLTDLRGVFGEGKIKFVVNNGEWDSAWEQVKHFIRKVCLPAVEVKEEKLAIFQ